MQNEVIDMSQWYTAPQALERLKANSGKDIDGRYLRYLAKSGKVECHVISERVRLYSRVQIDSYVVEERGTKSGRAFRQKGAAKRIETSQGKMPAKRVGRPRKTA